jgi:uncharacterized RDD family membrane protein YckC
MDEPRGAHEGDRPSGWALATADMHVPAPAVQGPGPVRRAEYASWWARLGGYLLDGLLAMLFVGALLAVLAVLAFVVDPDGLEELTTWFTDGMYGDPSGNALGWLLAGVAVVLVAYVWWEVYWIRAPRFMARPGQLVAGFRVVRIDTLAPVGTGRAFGRMLGKLGLGAVLGWLYDIVCAFTIGLGSRRQALHDLVAGTVCVRRSALASRGIGPDAVQGAGGSPPTLPRSQPAAPPVPGTLPPPSGSGTPPPQAPPAPPSGPFV